ncbi:portal protein [Paraburkholderia youngii]|uniref:Phage tail protein n=1 Tax=Paraburkholderia youngii TaxID=2782701 RepID=A0A7Y6JVK0_9BURK|nr:portal protein [Paraburkholderia youngii]NUX98778.1 phage tail protein [Paraburkholderia youngii]
MNQTAEQAWEALAGIRRPLLTRCEKYSAFTLPTIITPQGYNEELEELQTDFQSVGAQGVNNLANKLMLALFAPSRPFFRYQVSPQFMASLKQKLGISDADLQEMLAEAERNCIKTLDAMGVRPKLYEAMKHLIITGNCLLMLGKKNDVPMRVLSLKRFAVKRSMSGKVLQIIIHETVRFDELEQDVQDIAKTASSKYANADPNDPQTCPEVKYYTWVRWDGKANYLVTHHVDDVELPADKFGGKYTDETLPYIPLTWELHDDNDYGTGLVEQMAGDLAALSMVSEAEVKGAILASEFRWLVNPAGNTRPEDIEDSANGAALPGTKDDVIPLNTGTGQSMQYIDTVATKYVNRIGKGFLLSSSIVRDAERVTAEEIRMQANELETSLGGVYSRLAVDFQKPMAFWLTKLAGVQLGGKDIVPMVITGLDALSRNGDLDNLKLALQDLAAVSGMPPQALATLNLTAIAKAIFMGRGVDYNAYVKTEEQQQADMQNEQQAALAQQVSRPVAQAVMSGQPNQPQG